MSLFEDEKRSPDEYLALIEGWTDPNPAPVLETHDGIVVVRDDLLPAGAKSRFIDFMVREMPQRELVYGSSPRVGYGQISLAYVCQRHGKQATVFLAKAKELHPNSVRAQKYGAKIVEVGTGFMKVCEARAREYVAASSTRALVPFGLADDTSHASVIKVARSLPIVPDEVWTVAGSGTLNRGLQDAWPSAECFMVSVGHKLTPQEIGRATMIRHPLRFEQKCKPEHRPPFPSVLEYDAKAWQYVRERAARGKVVLFWNVGA